MLNANEIAHMLHRLGRSTRIGGAYCALPIADTNDAAGFGHAAHFVIGQIAVHLARRLHAAMAGDQGTFRHGQNLGNASMAEMRDVDDHALRFHPAQYVATERRQSAFFQAVHRPAQFIVKEMREPRHAEPCVVQSVEILGLAFKIMEAFNGQHRADRAPVLLPRGQQGIELLRLVHRLQFSVRSRDRVIALRRVIQRPFDQ